MFGFLHVANSISLDPVRVVALLQHDYNCQYGANWHPNNGEKILIFSAQSVFSKSEGLNISFIGTMP